MQSRDMSRCDNARIRWLMQICHWRFQSSNAHLLWILFWCHLDHGLAVHVFVFVLLSFQVSAQVFAIFGRLFYLTG